MLESAVRVADGAGITLEAACLARLLLAQLDEHILELSNMQTVTKTHIEPELDPDSATKLQHEFLSKPNSVLK